METDDRERLVALESDVKHIRKDTSEIKESISAFISQVITQISDQSVKMENLRVRTQAAEDKIKDVSEEIREQNTKLWKISIVVCVIASGMGIGADKLFGALGL